MSHFRLVHDCSLRRRSILFAARKRAMGSVDLIVGTREVVADLLGDELFALDGCAVAVDLEDVRLAFGDDDVAFGKTGCPVRGGAVGDEIVKRLLDGGSAIHAAESVGPVSSSIRMKINCLRARAFPACPGRLRPRRASGGRRFEVGVAARNRLGKMRRQGRRMSELEHHVRALWTLFEPIHAVTYFSPEAREAFAGIGLTRYWDGYFAGRAAPLGAVTAAPVVAIFSGFAPFLVERVLPAVWSTMTVDRVLDARSRGAAATLRNLVPDERSVAEAADVLAKIAARVDTIGRPLAAANSALAVEADPYRRLWQAAATLREHRGDGHVMALVEGGIAGISTIVLRSAVDIDATSVRKARGWTEEEWAVEVEELMTRGLLTGQGEISENGRVAVERAENMTNQLAVGPWRGLNDAEIARIARTLAPIARVCQTVFPFPNPIGMPRPWDPNLDPNASAVPVSPRAS
ncbi:hypothetical protein [Cryobacterium sp. M91]|uniref:SCO6745 family protein n=1 Tax=Cryobacterium sp. M91 TaxID=2048294 RepID=UPI0011B0C2EC|nr:hypothetical protein [Cryobacterium sp. M91]